MSSRPSLVMVAVLPVVILATACVVVHEEDEDGKTVRVGPALDSPAARTMAISSAGKSALPRHGSASM